MAISVYHADAVDGLKDGLPSRDYKQAAPFWVFVALQDWLRDEGNFNLLGYDTGSSVCSFPYPTRDDGERLTPQEVYYLFKNPPSAVAAQLPHCYCVVLQDDSPVLVRSFVVRKEDSPRFGEYGLTCASRRNCCGYFAWLSDCHAAAELDVAPASPAMLEHIRKAQRADKRKMQHFAAKKRAVRASSSMYSESGYSSSAAGPSEAAYSSEPDDSADAQTGVPSTEAVPGNSNGLLRLHAMPLTQTNNKRAATAHFVELQGSAAKRLRSRSPERGPPSDQVVAALPATALLPPAADAERPGSAFVWALTEKGADETAWDRAARRLAFCCGRVWEQFAIAKHRYDDVKGAEGSEADGPDDSAALVALHLFDPPGVLIEDWSTVAASMRRCCGRIWAPRVFNRVHNPCPNAVLLDD